MLVKNNKDKKWSLYRTLYLFYYCTFVLIFFDITPLAVADTRQDFQPWISFISLGGFNTTNQNFSKIKYWLEAQERLGDNSSRLSQTILRPGLGYMISKNTSIWLGYAWIYTTLPLSTNPFVANLIWQQLLWEQQWRLFGVSNRMRLEERFFSNSSTVSYRLRELLSINIPLRNIAKTSFILSDEIFWNLNNFNGLNNQGFNQNRFFIGPSYKIAPHAVIEIGYLNQYIYRVNGPNFVANVASIKLVLNY